MSQIDDQITILISTSHVPEHPETTTIDATIASIRQTLPESLIVIQCDGLSDKHAAESANANRMLRYQGYKSRLHGRYHNTVVLEYDESINQAGMLGRALEYVKTPLVAYVEHDWVLSPNIEWAKLATIIHGGQYNLIRFYAYCRIHPLHEGMCFEREIVDGIPFVRTIQYSQNPHLASSAVYRQWNSDIMKGQKMAIEEIMHSPCACGPWERWRLAIYNPIDEGSMLMARHIDGRKGER